MLGVSPVSVGASVVLYMAVSESSGSTEMIQHSRLRLQCLSLSHRESIFKKNIYGGAGGGVGGGGVNCKCRAASSVSKTGSSMYLCREAHVAASVGLYLTER